MSVVLAAPVVTEAQQLRKIRVFLAPPAAPSLIEVLTSTRRP